MGHVRKHFVLFPPRRTVCWWAAQCRPMLYSGFSACLCIFAAPCSLRLRLLHSRAVACHRGIAQRLRQCWAFLAVAGRSGNMNIHGAQNGVWKSGQSIMLPFVLGHLSRPWISLDSRATKSGSRRIVTSILLVVYSAFSEAVFNIWHRGWGSPLFVSSWSASHTVVGDIHRY
ncbi:bile acid:sodium symporter [Salmonella enterica subsp. enterica]|nr:bile acid:sodium symporter [Salmonella enterica subsp. enterica]